MLLATITAPTPELFRGRALVQGAVGCCFGDCVVVVSAAKYAVINIKEEAGKQAFGPSRNTSQYEWRRSGVVAARLAA